ncbi:MAG: transcription elongation factor GreA [Gammaproteobacteria bacterium]|nr:transcription elongation factor GreA [Gammaproteobacteria bacterium]MCD8542011.1 transcription elongation factor GreA [Gammaproteobacteria bacterium]
MSTKVPMTPSGAKSLEAELHDLKFTTRPKIIQAISEARAHGDLKENAEYHAAKEQQSFVEGRIKELEIKLSNAQIIDVTTLENTGKVIFGATVMLLNLEDDQKVSYHIVGDDEADFKVNKISYNTPMARAVIGKHEGDAIDVKTPNGIVEYEIISVVYQ